MNSTSKLSKLAELREKTDRELVKVIDAELERGLHFARIAREAKPAKDCISARQPRVQAANVRAQALKLLAKVDDVRQRRRLEEKLTLLEETLRQTTKTETASHAREDARLTTSV